MRSNRRWRKPVFDAELRGGGERVRQQLAHERDLHRRVGADAVLGAAVHGRLVLRRDRGRGVQEAVGAGREEVLVEERDLAQERPGAVAKERAVARPEPVVPVERRDPRAGAGPVDAVRLEVVLEAGSVAHEDREEDAAAAPESAGVRAEVVAEAVQQVEERKQRFGHAAAQRLGVHELDVLVEEVGGRPRGRVVAVPDALQVRGARAAEAGRGEQQVAAEVRHLLDEPRVDRAGVGVEEQPLVALLRRIRRREREARRAEAPGERRGVRGEERPERLAVEPRELLLERIEGARFVVDVDDEVDERRVLHDQRRGGNGGARRPRRAATRVRRLDWRARPTNRAVRVEQARHAGEVQAVGRPDGREDRAAANLGGEVVPAAVAGEVDQVVAG